MRINFSNNVSFGKGQLNIAATSDNHGKYEPVEGLYANLVRKQHSVFENSDKNWVKNLMIFGGDWFMEPAKKGFICDNDMTNGIFQRLYFNTLVENMKELLKGNLTVNYTPGNHCFDSGDKEWAKYAATMDAEKILTNVDMGKSVSFFEKIPEKFRESFKTAQVIEIPDDKNPNLKHKVLNLGVVIPGLGFYCPGLVNDLKILGDSDKKDAKIELEDLKPTFEALRGAIEKFKKENPKGAVILTSHAGGRISKMIAENVNNIDIIFNGHDHKDVEEKVGNTRIISLGDDSKFFKTLKIKFDDEGNYVNRDDEAKKYTTQHARSYPYNVFADMNRLFEQDKEGYFRIKGGEDETVLSQKGIRVENNRLANFATSALLAAAREIDPEIEIFGVASSAIRQDLPVNSYANNLELKNLFSGQTEVLSKIHTVELDGRRLSQAIFEYMKDHVKNPERNTIIQWAGIRISKHDISRILSQKPDADGEDIKDFIWVQDRRGKYIPLKNRQVYKLAVPSSFFMRPKMQTFIDAKGEMTPLYERKVDSDLIFAMSEEEFAEVMPIATLDSLMRNHIEKYKLTEGLKTPDADDIRIL